MSKPLFPPPFGDAQADCPCSFCDICRGEVYEYDLVHVIDGFVICPECFFDYIFDYYSDCLTLGSELNEKGGNDNDT